VVAVAARDESRAQEYASEHGIARAYGSYRELIDDPEIDLVYNALPASGHAPWTISALESEKHVLCEKPFGLHAEEAQRAVEVAVSHRHLLMEAHHWRYHPLVPKMGTALGSLRGDVKIEAVFNGGLNNPGDIRFSPALGPGVLMDYGCYTIQWSAWAAQVISARSKQEVPTVQEAQMTEAEPGIDLVADVHLDFHGISAHLLCDMRDEAPFRAYLRAEGENGFVQLETPLIGEGAKLEKSLDGQTETTVSEGPSTYVGQMVALLDALESGEPPITSGDDIVRTQRTLDAIYEHGGVISRRDLRQRALRPSVRPSRPPGE
jgi:predicted dehydrogenase